MVGQTIGHYQIVEKLGEGGMGIVYKATDTKLDRTVALKFLPDHVSVGTAELERFIQEAKAAAGLNHPNICTIYGIEESGTMNPWTSAPGAPPLGVNHFIVMEFVDGQTLQEKKSSLSIKQALDVGIQIAEGLAAAHEKGIVHRDVKPENIMIRKDGRVQIMDFGLAKLRGASRLTKEGSTVGTAGYMSPEQIQGQETDHRSDIFSLGVLLFEMLAGQAPFKGMHETAIAYEIVNVDSPPLASVKPDISSELDVIVMECLEKDPNERSQSAKQVAIDLKRHKRESSRSRLSRAMPAKSYASATVPTSPPAVTSRSLRPFLWPGVSLVLFVLLLFFVWTSRGDSPVFRPVMRFSINLPPSSLIFTTSSVDLSSDGRMLAYSGGVGVASQILVRRMDELDVRSIPGTNSALYPTFSPDGRWIAYEVNSTLMKIPVLGGAAQKLCNIGGLSRGIVWENDNSILFGHINRGIHRVSAAGGEPVSVTRLDSANGDLSHRFPQLLPDKQTIIYTVKQKSITTFDDAIIVAERMGSGERTILVRGGTYGRYIPSGHLVYVRAGAIYAIAMDASALKVTGQPVMIEKGGWLNQASGDAYLAFSTSGAFVFSPADPATLGVAHLSWLDRRGTLRPEIDSAGAYFSADISPDGTKMAVVIQAANDDVWVYHSARKTLTRFTFGNGNSISPIWSPDGQYIAYASERGTVIDIFRKPWDGSGPEEQLTHGLSITELSSYAPDGKALAFVQNGDIWILPLDDEKTPRPYLATPANEVAPSFSPDGRWLAYSSNESGTDEVYVVSYPLRGGKFQVSSGGGSLPRWTSDGKQLYYVTSGSQTRRRRAGGAVMKVDILNSAPFDYSAEQTVVPLPPLATVLDVSGNGQQYLIADFKQQALGESRLTVVLEWFDDLRSKLAGSATK